MMPTIIRSTLERLFIGLTFSLGLTNTANAELQPRDLDGNPTTIEAYYDTVLEITWLDFNPGQMTQNDAIAWAADLVVGANNDWRLPTKSPIDGSNTFNTTFISNNAATDLGYAKTTTDGSDGGWRDSSGNPVSEMGHLFYVTLANLGLCTPDDNASGNCDARAGSGLTNSGPFTTLLARDYWTGMPDVDTGFIWALDFSSGTNLQFASSVALFALAVHDGDVAAPASTLQPRDLDGNPNTIEAYYDTVLNITWLDFNPGQMTWDDAVAWADNLEVGGFNNWRLPTLRPIDGSNTLNGSLSNNATTDAGYARTTTNGADGGWRDSSGIPTSELGHLFYVTLANIGACTPDDASPESCIPPPQFGLSNSGPFTSLQASDYWTGREDEVPAFASTFSLLLTDQLHIFLKSSSLNAIAVHTGDVGTVPDPTPGPEADPTSDSGSDFDNDSNDDVLWRNTATGENAMFLMNGININTIALINTLADTDWKIAGIGDFDNDGNADILWRHQTTGENMIYLMNGLTILSETPILTVADTNWRVAGTGDFNNDNMSDILWFNDATGETYIFLMNGTTISAFNPIITAPANWAPAGVGDFNNDGNSDIIWRNSVTGENYILLMNGFGISGQGSITTVADTNWEIIGVGDFDNDNKSDVLWRNTVTGEVYIFLMNGIGIKASGSLVTVGDLNWKIEHVADFNNDGMNDIFWRNSVTGQNWMLQLSGISIILSQEVNTVTNLNWKVNGD